MKKTRVFLGLVEIAGYYRGLKLGFERLGVPVTFINLVDHRFQYGGDDDSLLVRFIRRAASRKSKFWRLMDRLGRGILFLWAAFNHDVFILGCNSSFFKDYRDIGLLKWLGKKVIYQYHGSDDRPPYLDGSAMAAEKNRSIQDCIEMTRRKKAIIKRIEEDADYLVSIQPQALLHERPFIQWLQIGLPIQPQGYPETLPEPDLNAEWVYDPQAVVRILHSPSHPTAKGTDRIRETIARLKAEGLPLQLIEVVGQPNHIVCQELARCDVVIDQLYADYGMPGFATEAAWYGKPVIIAGYPHQQWEEWLPPESVPPTCYIHPDTLEEALRQLALDPGYRQAQGSVLRHFVESRWSPELVAQRYLQLVSGDFPPSWWVDPDTLLYWQGCCLEETAVRGLIGRMIQEGGIEALQIGDKPDLEALMKKAAQLLPVP